MKLLKELKRLLLKPKRRTPLKPVRIPDWSGVIEMLELRSTGGITPIYRVKGHNYFYGVPIRSLVTLHPGARVKLTIEVLDRGQPSDEPLVEGSMN